MAMQESNGVKSFSAKRKGDITEMELCTHFLKEGYEVYKNVSCTGLIDIIILDTTTNTFKYYDSKTGMLNTKKDGTKVLYTMKTTDKQKELGVEIATLHDGVIHTHKDKIGVTT
jgi:hypothetical protein